METAPVSSSESSEGLSEILSEEEVSYRPISALAVLGLVLSLASTLALVTPWLGFLPLTAALVSWVAAGRIRSTQGGTGGRSLAVAGVAIGVLVFGIGWAERTVSDRLHRNSAKVVATAFLQALSEKDLVTAYELTRDFSDRMPSSELAEERCQSDSTVAASFREFKQSSDIQKVAGQSCVEAEVTPATRIKGGKILVGFSYRPEAKAEASLFNVYLERSAPRRLSAASWRVKSHRMAQAVN